MRGIDTEDELMNSQDDGAAVPVLEIVRPPFELLKGPSKRPRHKRAPVKSSCRDGVLKMEKRPDV